MRKFPTWHDWNDPANGELLEAVLEPLQKQIAAIDAGLIRIVKALSEQ